MKKVVLTLIALVAFAASDVSARHYNNGRRCPKACPVVEQGCNRPYVSRVEEQPCGAAPCCLTAVQVPAQLIQEISYHWECPTGCTVQNQ